MEQKQEFIVDFYFLVSLIIWATLLVIYKDSIILTASWILRVAYLICFVSVTIIILATKTFKDNPIGTALVLLIAPISLPTIILFWLHKKIFGKTVLAICIMTACIILTGCAQTIYVYPDGSMSNCPPGTQECVCRYCGGDGWVPGWEPAGSDGSRNWSENALPCYNCNKRGTWCATDYPRCNPY